MVGKYRIQSQTAAAVVFVSLFFWDISLFFLPLATGKSKSGFITNENHNFSSFTDFPIKQQVQCSPRHILVV